MTKRSKYLLAGIAALFVVVLMCAVGFSVLLVGISSSRRTALKAQCGTHLKGLSMAYAVYAAGWNDTLPYFGNLPPGSWMCDEKDGAATALIAAATAGSTGSSRASVEKLFYCPANTNQDPAVLWGGPVAPYRVMGYISTVDRPGTPSLTGLRDMPKLQYHSKMSLVQYAATTELLLDWIISDKAQAPESSGLSWTGITAPPRPGIYDTSHLSGKTPAGANVLTFDGAVTWRPFDPAKATPVPQTPGGPTFWIPNP